MSMLTLNGAPVLAMQLAFPVSGLWVATLEVDSEDALSGALTLQQDARSFAGAILRSGALAGTCRIEAVGGTGGLTRDIGARSYRDATARTVFEEILAAAGEASARAALTTRLPYWTRAAGRAAGALTALATALGTRWRVQPSGAVWMGTETWTTAPEFELTELDRDGAAGTVLIAPEGLDVLPGMRLKNGDRVGRIVYSVTRDSPLRATYSLET